MEPWVTEFERNSDQRGSAVTSEAICQRPLVALTSLEVACFASKRRDLSLTKNACRVYSLLSCVGFIEIPDFLTGPESVVRRVMVKKTLLQWRWALSGGPAQLDGEFVTSTLEEYSWIPATCTYMHI